MSYCYLLFFRRFGISISFFFNPPFMFRFPIPLVGNNACYRVESIGPFAPYAIIYFRGSAATRLLFLLSHFLSLLTHILYHRIRRKSRIEFRCFTSNRRADVIPRHKLVLRLWKIPLQRIHSIYLYPFFEVFLSNLLLKFL